MVDDDEPVRQLLASILSDAGYDVRAVGSAREARHALEHDTIALLLSDVRMPEKTGLDRISHALSKHPQTATLLISALDDPGITQVALDLGAYGYLSKPVRRSAVLIGVMNAARRRDMEARERAARETLEQTGRLHTDALSQTLAGLEHAAMRSHALQAETIHRWAQAAEHRQPGVRAHLTRMSPYCAVLADDLGLHAASVELASVLHDIGKLVIPDSILLKPAPLTADERLAIETHAEVGYQMLSGSSSDILDLAATIAWCHHERFDGRGYPRGLAGTEIPLEGRIAAIADVFDALTCDRAYRQALSPDEAISWMTCQRGKHFDPGVLTPTSDMSKTPMTTDARPAGHRAGRSDAGGRLRSSRNRPGAIRNARRKLGPEVLAEASRSGSCVAWLDGAATERAIARNVRPIATGPRSTADKGDVPVL